MLGKERVDGKAFTDPPPKTVTLTTPVFITLDAIDTGTVCNDIVIIHKALNIFLILPGHPGLIINIKGGTILISVSERMLRN